jgi:gamma-glutamylputrescine oxidase
MAYPADQTNHAQKNIANFNDVADDATRPTLGAPLYKDVEPDTRPTVVIIGAGYTGLSTALHLAQDKSKRVILLDAGKVGWGPSGKSAGHVGGLQADNDMVIKHCGHELGQKILAAAEEGPQLVRALVNQHGIACDMRDNGYLIVAANGSQSIDRSHGLCITPYPFVLGLAEAAKKAGVIIHENTPVTNVTDDKNGCQITTPHGSISADYVVAAGGHRMAETIPALAHLRDTTFEARVTTIVTDPLPSNVINAIMPAAEGKRLPFANDDMNIAYGSINEDGRLLFGSNARVMRDPNPNAIAHKLFVTFPSLKANYQKATGRELGFKTLVGAEKLSYTADLLPQVGVAGDNQRILHIGGLGGHGIGAGTMLGKAAAEKVDALMKGDVSNDKTFDLFASVKHAIIPAAIRTLAASTMLSVMNVADSIKHGAIRVNRMCSRKNSTPTP